MTPMPVYTQFHPRWYRTRMSTYWWLGRWAYLKFILRELTSVATAFFVVTTLLHLRALARGPEAYAEFLSWLRSPPVIVLNAVSFCFLIFHTITWFNLAPKAMAVRVRGKRVPDVLIALPNYLAWLIISSAVAWLLLGGRR